MISVSVPLMCRHSTGAVIMPSRVAVLSDIHGVRPALEAVLAEPEVHAPREDHLDLLGRLPRSLTLPVRGLGKVLFCHATPRDDEEVVPVDSRPDRRREAFGGLDPEVRTVVRGHTHMPSSASPTAGSLEGVAAS